MLTLSSYIQPPLMIKPLQQAKCYIIPPCNVCPACPMPLLFREFVRRSLVQAGNVLPWVTTCHPFLASMEAFHALQQIAY